MVAMWTRLPIVQAAPCGLGDDREAEGRSTRTACGRSARGGWPGGDFFVSRCKAARGGGKKSPPGRCGKAIGGGARTLRPDQVIEGRNGTAWANHKEESRVAYRATQQKPSVVKVPPALAPPLPNR